MRFELITYNDDGLMDFETFDTLEAALEYCADRDITVGHIQDREQVTSTPLSDFQ